MSVVYIVQETQRKDPASGCLVPKFDLSSAAAHGRLSYLLSPNASPWDSAVVEEICSKLLDYRPEEDYLLLVGNPVLMGVAAHAAFVAGRGRARFLQWSGALRRHIPVEVSLRTLL